MHKPECGVQYEVMVAQHQSACGEEAPCIRIIMTEGENRQVVDIPLGSVPNFALEMVKVGAAFMEAGGKLPGEGTNKEGHAVMN